MVKHYQVKKNTIQNILIHLNGICQVDIQNSDGFTALHMAAIDRKPARVNLLISR